MVLVQKKLQKDVAKEMRISPYVVTRLVSKFKKEGHMQNLL